MKQLYIFNGSIMLSHFNSKYPDDTKTYTSFNEAMCWGNADKDIFSERFVSERCLSLNTTRNDYTKNVIDPLKPLINNNKEGISLWFDTDMFCQINLLTLMAYLEQIDYTKSITFNLVNHSNDLIESYDLNSKGYKQIYETVVINKAIPNDIELPVMQKGIELYLHLQQEDNEIVLFVQEHKNLSSSELLNLLFPKFQNYGLGDSQYLQIINKTRSSQ